MLDTHAQPSDTFRRHAAIIARQDELSLTRLALMKARHGVLCTGGDVADYDARLADLYTSEIDLRIAVALIGDTVDPATLDRNGLTLGTDWMRVGHPSPYITDDPRGWATARQLAVEEYARQDDRPRWAA